MKILQMVMRMGMSMVRATAILQAKRNIRMRISKAMLTILLATMWVSVRLRARVLTMAFVLIFMMT